MARSDEEQSLGDALDAFLKGSKLRKGLDQVDITQAWSEVLGPGVSNYTQNVRLQGTTLYVSLSSSVLREELSLGRSRIVVLLNDHLGREIIDSIVLR